MPNHWDEIKNTRFEDRLAKMALAILYSSNHIDVTFNVSQGNEQYRKDQTEIFGLMKKIRKNGVKTELERFLWLILSKRTLKKSTSVTLTSDQLCEYRRLRWVESTRPTIRTDSQVQVAWPTGDDGELAVIFRGAKPKKTRFPVSEIDFDTVAIMIWDDSVFIACNYKRRRMPLTHRHYTYSHFGEMSQNSIGLITTGLRHGLVTDTSEYDDPHPADKIKFLVFVGLTTAPDDEGEGARPHAEMQLVSYMNDRGRDLKHCYFGVNKPCCLRCYKKLKLLGATCAEPPGKDFSNWDDPTEIRTKIVAVKYIL